MTDLVEVYAEEGGVKVGLAMKDGLVILRIFDDVGNVVEASVAYYRWERLCEATGFKPKDPEGGPDGWGRGMAASAAAGARQSKRHG